MRHYALIGEHLGHSTSRFIHEKIFRKTGLEADYRLLEIPPEHLAEELPRLLDTLDGFNVTIPYKQRVMPFLTSLTPLAEAAGAVNTVQCAKRHGANTDVTGFIQLLRHAGLNPEGRTVYVLGFGGAAQAVLAALRELRAGEIRVVSRHPLPGQMTYEQLPGAIRQTGGMIVNTTPAGMWPDTTGCPIAPEHLQSVVSSACGVADLIYNPPETVLTSAARACGVPWCTGWYMLVAQAVAAEELWQGHALPQRLTEEIMEELQVK